MIKFKKLSSEVTERLKRLPEVFSEHAEVVVVYLFGSFAKNEIKPLSDIDIAYLLDLLPYEDVLDKDLELRVLISNKLRTDEVDCHLLNKSPLPFQYEIITSGEVIYCRDSSAKESYEEEIKHTYNRHREDFEVTKEQLLRAFRE